MSVVSPAFLLGLGLVLLVYWRMRSPALQRDVLTAATLVFLVAWDARLAGLVLLASAWVWFGARQLAQFQPGDPERWHWTVASIAGLFGVWLALWSADFFREGASAGPATATAGVAASWPVVHLVIPIGLTFLILQAVGYIADVFRGEMQPRRSWRSVLAYIVFFPNLVGGPLLPAESLCDDFKRAKCLTRTGLAAAFRVMALGIVLKYAIADPVGIAIEPIFAALGPSTEGANPSNLALVGATAAFGAQVVFDLVGCALLAVGLSRLFGFALPLAHGPVSAPSSFSALLAQCHPTLANWINAYITYPATLNAPRETQVYRPIGIALLFGWIWAAGDGSLTAWITALGLLAALDFLFLREPGIRLPRFLGFVGTAITLTALLPLLRTDTLQDSLTVWAAFLGERAGGPDDLPLVLWTTPVILAAFLYAAGLSRPRAVPQSSLANPALHWAGAGCIMALILAFVPLPSLA